MKSPYVIKIGETMTPEHYLKLQQQKELDQLFDNAIKEAREKELSELAIKEKEQHFANLVSKLNDKECELNVCEDLIMQYTRDPNRQNWEVLNLKQTYKALKIQYTKTKNELDRLILE